MVTKTYVFHITVEKNELTNEQCSNNGRLKCKNCEEQVGPVQSQHEEQVGLQVSCGNYTQGNSCLSLQDPSIPKHSTGTAKRPRVTHDPYSMGTKRPKVAPDPSHLEHTMGTTENSFSSPQIAGRAINLMVTGLEDFTCVQPPSSSFSYGHIPPIQVRYHVKSQ